MSNIIFKVNEGIEEIKIPKGIKKVFLADNKIKKITKLPEGLTHLHIQNNLLEELPKLPSTLEHLDVDNNNLKKLPKLPKSLKKLSCNNNKMLDKSFHIEEKQDFEFNIGDYDTLNDFLNDNFFDEYKGEK